MAVASLVGPSQAAISGGVSGREVPLDGVAGHHRIVHQETQRDYERGDGNLLQIQAEHVHHAEGHGQRDGNRQGHQEGRSPLPEADQGNDHNQDDGLVQAVHEQVDAFLNLARLIGGARHDEIRR